MIKVSLSYSGYIQTNCHESGVGLGKCQMSVHWGQRREAAMILTAADVNGCISMAAVIALEKLVKFQG